MFLLQGSFCGRIMMSCQLSPGVVALFIHVSCNVQQTHVGTIVFFAGQFLYEDIVPVMCLL